jgi:ABC-type dipeptide/oligopeptide/nickel transport system permease subunit
MAFARTLRHQPLGVIGLLLLVLFVVIAVLAPAISPYDPAAIDLSHRLRMPTGLAPMSSAATSSPAFFRVRGSR